MFSFLSAVLMVEKPKSQEEIWQHINKLQFLSSGGMVASQPMSRSADMVHPQVFSCFSGCFDFFLSLFSLFSVFLSFFLDFSFL